MMKSNPTSDCNRCRMCPDTSKWHSGTFYCPATKLITPNMLKWCRHYDPDENARESHGNGPKIEDNTKDGQIDIPNIKTQRKRWK